MADLNMVLKESQKLNGNIRSLLQLLTLIKLHLTSLHSSGFQSVLPCLHKIGKVKYRLKVLPSKLL